MFYDMQGDPTGSASTRHLRRSSNPAQVAAALHCVERLPVRGGRVCPRLPGSRCSTHGAVRRGQIPIGRVDEFHVFTRASHTLGPTRLGVTLFSCRQRYRVARTPVAPDDIVVSRYVDRAALDQVFANGAGSWRLRVIFFRLADGSDPSGWSRPISARPTRRDPTPVAPSGGEMNARIAPTIPHAIFRHDSPGRRRLDRGYALDSTPGAAFREGARRRFLESYKPRES